MQQSLFNDLEQIEGLKVEKDISLTGFTTFRIGGRAKLFLTPLSIRALEQALHRLKQAGVSFKILGNGSNLLVSDAGIGAVISLLGLANVISSNGYLTVHAGMTISRLLKWCVDNGMGGIEALAGIPGTLGGALFMNAGACGCEIGNYVEEILLTGPGGSSWMRPSGDTFSYRSCKLPQGTIISAVRIRVNKGQCSYDASGSQRQALAPCSRRHCVSRIRQVMKKRFSSQPLGKPSAGCVFKNPQDVSAWSLIASCGLQGFRNGDAQVSEKHANFIINRGRACFAQVKDLIEIVKERVREQTGVLLKEELVIWEDDIVH